MQLLRNMEIDWHSTSFQTWYLNLVAPAQRAGSLVGRSRRARAHTYTHTHTQLHPAEGLTANFLEIIERRDEGIQAVTC